MRSSLDQCQALVLDMLAVRRRATVLESVDPSAGWFRSFDGTIAGDVVASLPLRGDISSEALTWLGWVAEDELVVGLGKVGKLRQALWC